MDVDTLFARLDAYAPGKFARYPGGLIEAVERPKTRRYASPRSVDWRSYGWSLSGSVGRVHGLQSTHRTADEAYVWMVDAVRDAVECDPYETPARAMRRRLHAVGPGRFRSDVCRVSGAGRFVERHDARWDAYQLGYLKTWGLDDDAAFRWMVEGL